MTDFDSDPLVAELDKMLLSERTIILNKRCINSLKTTGIYFLLSGNKIVYIGQSTNLYGRVNHHFNSKDIDAVSWLPCDSSELDMLEKLYIAKFRPRLNQKQYRMATEAERERARLKKGRELSKLMGELMLGAFHD